MTDTPLYCLVTNGVIVEGPHAGPQDGPSDPAALLALGWYPYVNVWPPPVFDPTTQAMADMNVVSGTTVTRAYTVTALSPDQVSALAAVTAADTAAAFLAAQNTAIAVVNNNAGASRSKFLTIVPGQESTYMYKGMEADAYRAVLKAGGTPVATDYPFSSAEAAACNTTLDAVINLISFTADQWLPLAAMIEGLRRAGSLAIQACTTIDQLNALPPVVFP